MAEPLNVLFLCTGNSARSIMAEAVLNAKGAPRFRVYSAGSHPSGAVKPEALRQIQQAGLPSDGLRSKSWDEFAQPGAPPMDFVFTVCDNAANETCPLWPGRPISAHWGVPDPAAAVGTADEIARAYRQAFTMLESRIRLLLALPVERLEHMALQQEVQQIGRQ